MHILEKVEFIISNYWLNQNYRVNASEGSGRKKMSWRESFLPFREDLSKHWQKLLEYGHRKSLARTTNGKRSWTLGA